MSKAAPAEAVKYRKVGCAALLTIDRPHAANSIDLPTAVALSQTLDSIRSDAGIRGIVITGAGGRIFCSGGDLKAYSKFETPKDLEDMVSRLGGLLDSLKELPLPVIAAIDGQAIGGGAELALACDLRFASSAATIVFPQVKLGIIPGWSGLERLTQLCGPSTAMRLLMSTRRVSAEEALRCGLVDEVSSGTAVDLALEFVASLAATAPMALAAVKRLVHLSAVESREVARRAISEKLCELWFSADHREAELAFREKRPPKFVGS